MSWTRRFRRRLKKKLQTAKKPRKVHLEALEPRILLSSDPLSDPAAAGPAAAAAVDLEDDDGTDPLLLIDSAGQSTMLDGALDPKRAVDLAAGAMSAADVSASDDAVIASQPSASLSPGRQIAFVERGAADPRALIDAAGPADGAESVSNLEVVTIDSDGDGIAQITDYLLDARDIAAIHVFSHGAIGSLQLGGARLDSDALDAYATQLAVWGAALAEDADILLYGCSVAGGRQGAAYVEDLAARTGADIAASTDLSGAADLGGDWDLEFKTGSIEATVVPLAQGDLLLAAPTDIQLDNSSIDENQAAGTAVGSLSATDADTGDTHIFSLVAGTGDTDNASFQISGAELQTTAAFDYESQNSYSIRVQADDGTNTFSKELSVTVSDVNEAPQFSAVSPVNIGENLTTAFTALASDPDTGDTLAYSISGGADGTLFEIGESTGVVTFKNNPDYEDPLDDGKDNTFVLEVTATDSGGLTGQFTQTVNVINNSTEPTITSAGLVTIDENTTAVQTVTYTHPDGAQNMSYALSGPDSDLFTIDDSGNLSFLTAPDYETPLDTTLDNDYEVTVTVINEDDLGRDSNEITVTVADITLLLKQSYIDNAASWIASENVQVVDALTFDHDFTIEVDGKFEMMPGARLSDSDAQTADNLTIVASEIMVTGASIDLEGALVLQVVKDDESPFEAVMDFITQSDTTTKRIEIDGATIDAGEVTIGALIAANKEVQEAAATNVNPLVDNFVGDKISDLIDIARSFVLPASVSIRVAGAGISINDSSISSAGDILVDAYAETLSDASVISLYSISPIAFSVTYAEAVTTAIIDITGSTTLTSTAGGVHIKSHAQTEASASTDLYVDAKFAVGAAAALFATESTTTIGQNVYIEAYEDVSIKSQGDVSGSARSGVRTPPTSNGAFSISFSLSDAEVTTEVGGTIIAQGSTSVIEVDMSSFTGGQELTLISDGDGHGLETGHRVIYENTTGEPIGQLGDGLTYYAVVDAAKPSEVQLALSLDDAYSGEVLDLSLDDALGDTHSLTPVADQQDFDAATIISDQIVFSASHGLSTGDEVVYTAGGNDSIDGLTNLSVYYVIKIDDLTISLAATPGRATDAKAIALTPADEAQTHGLIVELGSSTPFVFDPFDSTVLYDQENIIDYGQAHGLSTGDALLYGSGSIGGLRDGETLLVVSTGSDTVELRRAEQIDLDNSLTSSASKHTLTPIEYVEFDPIDDVDTNSNVITIPSHGFSDGDIVTFVDIGGEGTSLEDGPQTATDYAVHSLSTDTFRLYQDSTFTTQINFEDEGADVYLLFFDADLSDPNYDPFSFDPTAVVDSDSDTITISSHGLSTGDLLRYDTDPDNEQLQNGIEHFSLDPDYQWDFLFHPDARVDVDYDTDEITIGPHCLQTGDLLIYSSQSDVESDVGGLTDGVSYYAIVVDTETIRLTDTAGNAIDLTDNGLSTYHRLQSTRTTVDLDRDTIFQPNHGLSDDDELNYIVLDENGTAIGGLQDGQSYYVKVVDEHNFALAEAAGAETIDLTEGASGILHDFQFAATIVAGDPPIRGLQAGHVYYAVINDANSIWLAESPEDALQAESIDLDHTVAAASGHELTPYHGSGSGIDISARLEVEQTTANVGIATPSYGDWRMLNYTMVSKQLSNLLSQTGNQKAKAGSEKSPTFQAGISGAAAIADHDVVTRVNGATLKSGTDIRVDGQIVQNSKKEAWGIPVTANSKDTKLGLAVGFALGYYHNDVNVEVATGSQLDAAGDIEVDSRVKIRPEAVDVFYDAIMSFKETEAEPSSTSPYGVSVTRVPWEGLQWWFNQGSYAIYAPFDTAAVAEQGAAQGGERM